MSYGHSHFFSNSYRKCMNQFANNQITVLTSKMSPGVACRYGFFDRYGGIGTTPFNSMNVSYAVGDQENVVFTNRQRVEKTLGLSFLLSAKQVHGDGIYCLSEAMNGNMEIEGVDALITDQPGVGLMIQQADCQAILLFDPLEKVVAAIHCGWRGSVINIVARVVQRLKSGFGTLPENLMAVISPSLGPCCAEFVNYRSELPVEFRPFMVRQDFFDFWQISKDQLAGIGVRESKITIAGICTCCSKDYFSYRRASKNSAGITGRNCSAIVMDKWDR